MLGLILTTVISYMINPITKAFVTKSKEYSIMQHLQLLEKWEDHQGANSVKSYLKRTYFWVYLFSRAKKIVLREYLFSRMANLWKFREYLILWMTRFWKFRIYKFQPQRKKNKKNTAESRDIWLFLSNQRKDRQVTMERLILKKKKLN